MTYRMKGGTLVPGAMGILSCHVARQPRKKFDALFGAPGGRVKKLIALSGFSLVIPSWPETVGARRKERQRSLENLCSIHEEASWREPLRM